MIQISLRDVVLFSGTLAGQLGAVTLLPRTAGFTAPGPTAACLFAFCFSIWAIARLLHAGANLSILIPILNAIVPVGAVAIGLLLYSESASSLKIALLLVACSLIGLAARVA
jgi:multidrug transporter EmrE-like cation transporter